MFKNLKIPHKYWKRAHHIAHLMWVGSLSALHLFGAEAAEYREYAIVALLIGEGIAVLFGNDALRDALVEYEA